jgi:hypothetical protein
MRSVDLRIDSESVVSDRKEKNRDFPERRESLRKVEQRIKADLRSRNGK